LRLRMRRPVAVTAMSVLRQVAGALRVAQRQGQGSSAWAWRCRIEENSSENAS